MTNRSFKPLIAELDMACKALEAVVYAGKASAEFEENEVEEGGFMVVKQKENDSLIRDLSQNKNVGMKISDGEFYFIIRKAL
jgi:hypothetical protein